MFTKITSALHVGVMRNFMIEYRAELVAQAKTQ